MVTPHCKNRPLRDKSEILIPLASLKKQTIKIWQWGKKNGLTNDSYFKKIKIQFFAVWYNLFFIVR